MVSFPRPDILSWHINARKFQWSGTVCLQYKSGVTLLFSPRIPAFHIYPPPPPPPAFSPCFIPLCQCLWLTRKQNQTQCQFNFLKSIFIISSGWTQHRLKGSTTYLSVWFLWYHVCLEIADDSHSTVTKHRVRKGEGDDPEIFHMNSVYK